MAAEDGAIGQQVSIVNRDRREGSDQQEAVSGVHRGMILETEVGGIVTDSPAGFEVAGGPNRLAVFIPLALFGFSLFALLFQLIVAQRTSGGFDQSGIHGHALVDAKPLLLT
jgi:hypothetical protein